MNADRPDRTVAEADSRIADLETQHTADQGTIHSLEVAEVAHQETIAGLESVGVIDREVIAQLELDGIIDQTKIANLEVALASCRRIGAAMGVVMATRKVTEEQAFTMLRQASQDTHRKLRDVADDVLLTGTIG